MRGGIGLILFDEDNDIVYEESITIDRKTNSAEIELLSLVEVSEYAEDGDFIYSDSDDCVKGFNTGWAIGKTEIGAAQNKKPVKSRQLWKKVDELYSKKYVEVVKVKAHSGIEGNKRADTLAVDAARKDID